MMDKKAIMEAIWGLLPTNNKIWFEQQLERILTEQLGDDRSNAEAVGFAFGFACSLLDKGQDPRTYEIPKVLDAWDETEPAPPEDNVCKSAKNCNLNESLASQKVYKCQWCGSESIRKYCISCDNLQLPEFHKDGEA